MTSYGRGSGQGQEEMDRTFILDPPPGVQSPPPKNSTFIGEEEQGFGAAGAGEDYWSEYYNNGAPAQNNFHFYGRVSGRADVVNIYTCPFQRRHYCQEEYGGGAQVLQPQRVDMDANIAAPRSDGSFWDDYRISTPQTAGSSDQAFFAEMEARNRPFLKFKEIFGDMTAYQALCLVPLLFFAFIIAFKFMY